MTTIRVWLSATAEPDFETRGERQGIPNIYWQGFEVKYDKPTCQRPFLSLYFDPLDPTVKLPSFPKGTVREVTFTDRYWTGSTAIGGQLPDCVRNSGSRA